MRINLDICGALHVKITSKIALRPIYEPTMMLLIGMCISLTKKPMKPMMQKPMAVAIAIFWNSEIKKKNFAYTTKHQIHWQT